MRTLGYGRGFLCLPGALLTVRDGLSPFYSLVPQHDLIRSELNNCFRKLTDRGNFILGDEVTEFEDAQAKFTGAKHGIGAGGDSDALTLSLAHLGIGPGDLVIAPALTCSPT